MKTLLAGLRPVHPGETLREDVLPALRKPKSQIAAMLGVSRQTLYDVLKEDQRITADLALRIGKLTGTTPESWLRMQNAYDLNLAESKIVKALTKIPKLEAAE